MWLAENQDELVNGADRRRQASAGEMADGKQEKQTAQQVKQKAENAAAKAAKEAEAAQSAAS